VEAILGSTLRIRTAARAKIAVIVEIIARNGPGFFDRKQENEEQDEHANKHIPRNYRIVVGYSTKEYPSNPLSR
jgi:hypothetical protein